MGRFVNPDNSAFQVALNSKIYMDKTGLLEYTNSVLDTPEAYICNSRPRRFGKSYTANMLAAYYSKGCDSEKMFDGLTIGKSSDFKKHLNKYDVIHIDVQWFLSSCADIKSIISYITQSVLEELKEYYPEVLPNEVLTLADALSRIRNSTGQKFIVIIDEWDILIRDEATNKAVQEEYIYFLRGLFKGTEPTKYIQLAYLTGILPIKKEKTQSALNNFDEFTMVSAGTLAPFIGFTEEEVFHALEENGLSDEKGTVRYWYDGFSFGKRKDIYNPWSITKYLDTGEYGTYWADTSGNMLISNLIRRSPAKIKTEMEDLLNGRVICTELDEQVIFEQLGRKRGAIWSLMLASGYLKVDRYEMDNRTGKRQYDLKVTNHETMLMFEQMIEDWFTEEDSAYGNFKDALLAGDLDYMNQFMNQVALQTFSSFDTGGKPSEELEPERFYHGFVLGLIVDLAGKYRITSNRESGFGRYDVVMEPLKENLDAIVMEFKVQNTSKEKSLEETVEHALRQIQEKQYDTELLARGIAKERIRYYGFAFRGKKVLIGN